MPETQQIPTFTIITESIDGTDICFESLYAGEDEDDLPNTIQAYIVEEPGVINGVPFLEGELYILTKNDPTNIFGTLADNGDLIVATNTGDTNLYVVNPDGTLQWN